MICLAYRRIRSREKPDACIAHFDTETHVFQILTKDGRASDHTVNWEHTTTARHFCDWVQTYSEVWSLCPQDAFWFDPDLEVDKGL